MSKSENKTAALAIRIPPTLKAMIERYAEEDRRSVASYVELVLERHIDERKKHRVKA